MDCAVVGAERDARENRELELHGLRLSRWNTGKASRLNGDERSEYRLEFRIQDPSDVPVLEAILRTITVSI